MLDGEDVTRQKEGRILGYAQVGLSTRKMNSKILKSFSTVSFLPGWGYFWVGCALPCFLRNISFHLSGVLPPLLKVLREETSPVRWKSSQKMKSDNYRFISTK